ncbi:hypothetical protein NRIC_26240 [Enterococcus florum]|uniref:Uncharacterized protein n=1 Tax=Enterococcus florum TaxID=2480627 RepID=A0A4P5PNI6_9ENTE|nr:hypothetical protein [Enterococcus florum]GCF94733.1 hypothetical protein NRIC_26240 [Enterococcus florum]
MKLVKGEGGIVIKKAIKAAAIFLALHILSLPAWAKEVAASSYSTQKSSTSSYVLEETSTDSSEEETVSSSEVSEPPVSESASEAAVEEEPDSRAAVGSGIADNPYLVTTFQELKDVLNIAAGGQTKYIKLENDIVYNANWISINQSTVIDGDGHALLYSGSNYDTPQFSTGANNIDVHYKNLSFGSSTYPNSSWYGILYTGSNGIRFTVENVNYHIQNGSQPFWGNNGSSNTLTFKGKNQFYSSGRSNGGEFIEGFRTVSFAEDSDTTVYNDSPNATGVFYSTSQSVTVEKRASLAIESSKDYLFYNSAVLNVQEQAKFSYKKIRGTNYVSNMATLCTAALTMNFDEASIGHFTTNANSFSGSNPTINANAPDSIVFDAASTSKQVLSSMSPIFKRVDTAAALYKLAYLSADGQKTYVPKVNSGASYSVASRNIDDGYSFVYAPMPSIDQPTAAPVTGPDISSLEVQLTAAAPATTSSSNVRYKLANKRLYSGALAEDTAQDSIQNADTTNGVNEVADIVLTNHSLPVGAETNHSFTRLLAGNYYVYAQADDQRIAGYTFESLWQETVAEVPPYVLIQFSNKALAFDSPKSGPFGKEQNLEEYTMRNAGNLPTEIRLKEITRKAESSPAISLVEQFNTKQQEVILSLIAEKVDSGTRVTLGPLTEKDPLSLTPVLLHPFWDTDAQAALYLAGDYSGPLTEPQTLSYRFSFTISGVPTN